MCEIMQVSRHFSGMNVHTRKRHIWSIVGMVYPLISTDNDMQYFDFSRYSALVCI